MLSTLGGAAAAAIPIEGAAAALAGPSAGAVPCLRHRQPGSRLAAAGRGASRALKLQPAWSLDADIALVAQVQVQVKAQGL